jgi:hypothetical protein
MRTVIPGQVSSKYIEALYDLQKEFLESITASDEDAIRYRKACPDWIKEAEERDKLNGISR